MTTISCIVAALAIVAAWPFYRLLFRDSRVGPVEEIDLDAISDAIGPFSGNPGADTWAVVGGFQGALKLWRNSERIVEVVSAALEAMGYDMDAQREFRKEGSYVRRCLLIAILCRALGLRWLCRLHTFNAAHFYCALAGDAAIICAEMPPLLHRMYPGI